MIGKAFRAVCLAALVAFTGAPAMAESVSVTWQHPSARVDGSSLAVSEIRETRVEWGSCAGTAFGTVAGNRVVPAPATATSIDLPFGAYCFRAFTVDTTGRTSDASATVAKRVVGPPNPPVIATVEQVVYELRSHPVDGVMLGRAVGTIDLGVECLGLAPMLGFDYFAVPRAAVDLNRRPKSEFLVARCGVRS